MELQLVSAVPVGVPPVELYAVASVIDQTVAVSRELADRLNSGIICSRLLTL